MGSRRGIHLAAVHLVLAVVSLFLLLYVYHTYIEDDRPVWISAAPPYADPDVVHVGAQMLNTWWRGRYRLTAQECPDVEWHREIVDARTGGSIWKHPPVPPSDMTLRPTPREPVLFRMPLPPLTAGDYLFCWVEVAHCNIWKAWRNLQGCVPFSVVDGEHR